jgi:hypothetical protein
MKKFSVIILVLVIALLMAGCGSGKQSAVEGKLVDWNGEPVSGVKITASQVQPIKGYEQFEAVTGADGSFRIRGLFPSSQYVLKPWSDKWTANIEINLDSASQDETAVLPNPMKIAQAFSKKGGSLVMDLTTGATRFTVSEDGVIADSQTRLEWIVGPDSDTNYPDAEQWVANCNVAGGNWRKPTQKELATLYQKGIGDRNMDPAFRTTGWLVWAEPHGSSTAWHFHFDSGRGIWVGRGRSSGTRVFGVRSRD